MKRADLFDVRVSLEGRDLGVWDKLDGGEVDSEETTYKPGGTDEQITLGGTVATGNVTVQRLFDENALAVYHWLVQRTGRANGTVVMQPLDSERRPFGRPIVYSVKLKRVSRPAYDSEGNEAALIELEFTVNGRPS